MSALGCGRCAPQSGHIFGVLSNMKESFEAKLDYPHKDESNSIATFQQLKTAKDDASAAGTNQITTKTE